MKRFATTFYNEWRQIFGTYNWYDFTLVNIQLRKDKILPAYELFFMIIGFGFCIRYNLKESDTVFEKYEKEVQEILNRIK